MTIVNDGPSCGVTYDGHSGNSMGVIMFAESCIMLLANIYRTDVTHSNPIEHHVLDITAGKQLS
jgi:hypothetical protein